MLSSTDREVEGAGDGREDLRGRVLEAALDLGEVLGRDARALGHVGQPLLARLALAAQLGADELAPQRLLGRRLAHGLAVGTFQRQHLTHAATVGRERAEGAHGSAVGGTLYARRMLSIVAAAPDHLEEWRAIHNAIIPTAPLSAEEVAERATRNRLTLGVRRRRSWSATPPCDLPARAARRR